MNKELHRKFLEQFNHPESVEIWESLSEDEQRQYRRWRDWKTMKRYGSCKSGVHINASCVNISPRPTRPSAKTMRVLRSLLRSLGLIRRSSEK
jgi:hypothetical protein